MQGTPIVIAFSLALGAVIGSFLNVVIARLPKGENLVCPGSRCPACRAPIRWFHNIPLLSFAWLGGRCQQCRRPISWQYPLVEGVTAGLFALAAWRIGPGPGLLAAWVFLAALVAITGIDLEHQLIPDRITLPGIVVGFVTSLVNPSVSWLDSLLGIAFGGGVLFVIIVASRGGMGGGDMKLGAMIGAFLGWQLIALTLLLAVLLGGLIAATLLITGLKKRKDPIPFGPFLASSALVSLFWGDLVLRWYWRGFAF
jgi:leader peptidase (prepilin peptidase) / N-methyltransferase